jgi:hypothetical protein
MSEGLGVETVYIHAPGRTGRGRGRACAINSFLTSTSVHVFQAPRHIVGHSHDFWFCRLSYK